MNYDKYPSEVSTLPQTKPATEKEPEIESKKYARTLLSVTVRVSRPVSSNGRNLDLTVSGHAMPRQRHGYTRYVQVCLRRRRPTGHGATSVPFCIPVQSHSGSSSTRMGPMGQWYSSGAGRVVSLWGLSTCQANCQVGLGFNCQMSVG
jgi:hypothetical protein